MQGTLYIQKGRGHSYPTSEVPGMTHQQRIRNAHAIRMGICLFNFLSILLLPGFRTFQIK